jgi:hypothetical protein
LASLPAPSWPLRHCNHGPTQELCQHPHCHCSHINTLDPRCCRSTSALTTTTPASAPLQWVALLRLRNFLRIRDYTFTYRLRVTIHLQIPLPSVMCHCVT